MRELILLCGLLVAACTSGRAAVPLNPTHTEPSEPQLVSCTYDGECFGGRGTCLDGECSLRQGVSGARRSHDKPSPPPRSK